MDQNNNNNNNNMNEVEMESEIGSYTNEQEIENENNNENRDVNMTNEVNEKQVNEDQVDIKHENERRLSNVRNTLKAQQENEEQQVIREWIENVLKIELPIELDKFYETISDGEILCRLINALHLEKSCDDDLTDSRVRIENIHTSETTHIRFLRAYENTTKFLVACNDIGLHERDLFGWSDLVKNTNFSKVIYTLSILKQKCTPVTHSTPMSATNKKANPTNFMSPSLGLLEVLSTTTDMTPKTIVKKVRQAWTPSAPFNLSVPVTSNDNDVTTSSPSTEENSTNNENTMQQPNTVELQTSINKIYQNMLKRRDVNIQDLCKENTEMQKMIEEYRRAMKQEQEKSNMNTNTTTNDDTSNTTTTTNNNNNNNNVETSEDTNMKISELEADQESHVMNNNNSNNKPIKKDYKKKVLKAKSLLQKAVFNPIQRVNSAWSTFANGVSTLLEDMKTDMEQTSKIICNRIENESKLYKNLEESFNQEQEERKRLLNRVIELQGNIRVYTRIRPMSNDEKSKGNVEVIQNKGRTVTINDNNRVKEFQFDHVFDAKSTQEDVFNEVRPLVHSAIDGYSVCIFAYGQTGSGKTYTMAGEPNNEGLNLRSLHELFNLTQQRQQTHNYSISLSILEIYNEIPTDLLQDKKNRKKLSIRKNQQLGVHIPELKQVNVENVNQVTNLMVQANSNRSVGSTSMNEHSSRSHSVVMINIHGTSKSTMDRTVGRLFLIDLAGSERIKKSQATGERLKEAQHINKSLSALGNVIASLQQQNSHIPFRDSKLTYLLQDHLSGNSKCLMFCQISPIDSSSQETMCSLQFASRVAKVQLGQASANVQDGENLRLRQTLNRYKDVKQDHEKSLETLKKEKKNMMLEIEEKVKLIEQLKSNDQQQSVKTNDLNQELIDSKSTIKAQRNQLQNKEEECTTLRDEIAHLKKQLADAKHEAIAAKSRANATKHYHKRVLSESNIYTVKEEVDENNVNKTDIIKYNNKRVINDDEASDSSYTTPVKRLRTVVSTPLSDRRAVRTPLTNRSAFALTLKTTDLTASRRKRERSRSRRNATNNVVADAENKKPKEKDENKKRKRVRFADTTETTTVPSSSTTNSKSATKSTSSSRTRTRRIESVRRVQTRSNRTTGLGTAQRRTRTSRLDWSKV